MPPADSDITLGEVYRALMDHRKATEDGFKTVNRRIDGLNVVHRDTYEAAQSADRDRIGKLESRSTWIARTLGAATATLLVTMGGNAIYLLQVHR